MTLFPKKRKIWPYVLVSVFLIFFGLIGYAWYKVNSFFKIAAHVGQRGNSIVTQNSTNTNVLDLLPTLGGFNKPHTYLILFQNNTELRPGGGFIGSYAIARFDQGKMQIMKIEGTETLDNGTPPEWKVVPPKPLKKYLGVNNWYFRDSNWSPDFVENVQRAVAFYTGEKGYLAGDIDTVVAVTPDLLSAILKRSGPISLYGKEFNSENATEALEYEVEYGFLDHGVQRTERKKVIGELFTELVKKLKTDVFLHSDFYINLVNKLAGEKQIMAYSRDSAVADFLQTNGLTGQVVNTSGDYLLWVDANLGALKTDYAMDRSLNYEIGFNASGSLVATSSMNYKHNGKFDWRTTRYLTYARVYAPLGSQINSVSVLGKRVVRLNSSAIDSGQEFGKQWFGFFVSIEPQEDKTVQVSYSLPDSLKKQIQAGNYDLYVQKQAGAATYGLTLGLKFGNNITSAIPAEDSKFWGDQVYTISSDLSVDRQFQIRF